MRLAIVEVLSSSPNGTATGCVSNVSISGHGFKALNKAITPEAYQKSRVLSVPLSRLGGEVAYHQARFVAEDARVRGRGVIADVR